MKDDQFHCHFFSLFDYIVALNPAVEEEKRIEEGNLLSFID